MFAVPIAVIIFAQPIAMFVMWQALSRRINDNSRRIEENKAMISYTKKEK